jgi:hypothetical protein
MKRKFEIELENDTEGIEFLQIIKRHRQEKLELLESWKREFTIKMDILKISDPDEFKAFINFLRTYNISIHVQDWQEFIKQLALYIIQQPEFSFERSHLDYPCILNIPRWKTLYIDKLTLQKHEILIKEAKEILCDQKWSPGYLVCVTHEITCSIVDDRNICAILKFPYVLEEIKEYEYANAQFPIMVASANVSASASLADNQYIHHKKYRLNRLSKVVHSNYKKWHKSLQHVISVLRKGQGYKNLIQHFDLIHPSNFFKPVYMEFISKKYVTSKSEKSDYGYWSTTSEIDSSIIDVTSYNSPHVRRIELEKLLLDLFKVSIVSIIHYIIEYAKFPRASLSFYVTSL